VTLFEVSAFKRIDFGILKLLSLVAFDLIDLGALTLLGLIICKLLDMIILKLHRWLAMIHMKSRRNQRHWCRDFAGVTIFLQLLSDSSSRRRPGSSVFRISPVNA
jgi:hypothetical protein